MNYKIWRKDGNEWSLAFDTIYSSKILVDERISELNAVYHELIRFNELTFYAYPEDIKISKNGFIISNEKPKMNIKKNKYYNKRKKKNKQINNSASKHVENFTFC